VNVGVFRSRGMPIGRMNIKNLVSVLTELYILLGEYDPKLTLKLMEKVGYCLGTLLQEQY
jgi:hypothetical protein